MDCRCGPSVLGRHSAIRSTEHTLALAAMRGERDFCSVSVARRQIHSYVPRVGSLLETSPIMLRLSSDLAQCFCFAPLRRGLRRSTTRIACNELLDGIAMQFRSRHRSADSPVNEATSTRGIYGCAHKKSSSGTDEDGAGFLW